jgi:hypothetical protein
VLLLGVLLASQRTWAGCYNGSATALGVMPS